MSSENGPATGSSKIYTRTGDKGKTSLIGGTRVSKSHLRLETYGTIDELNSVLGLLIAELTAELPAQPELRSFLQRTQSDLFDIGSHLACEDADLRKKLPVVDETHIKELETEMDRFSATLPALKNFILPGGSRASSIAHLGRTVCRRAERLCVSLAESENSGETSGIVESPVELVVVRYVNRLSDYLFVLARHINKLAGTPEILWAPRKGV